VRDIYPRGDVIMGAIINPFRKAERKMAKARIGICGPSGSGKTYSSLLMGRGLVGPFGSLVLIDTERGSGELYSHLTDYDIAILESNFDPENYIQLIKAAEKVGYDCIIIDSISHAWEGTGGILSMHDMATKKFNNSFTAWRDITPKHNALVDTILQSPCHIIVTLRAKTHYDLSEEQTPSGRTVIKPKKIGLKPAQREGFDYELTTVFNLTQDGHIASVSKDRTGLFDGKDFVPGIETGELFAKWLNSGAIDHQPNPPVLFHPPAAPTQPATAPSLKVQFDAAIRKHQEAVNAQLAELGLPPLTDIQQYRIAVGQWIKNEPAGQLNTELLHWVQEHPDDFVQSLVLHLKNNHSTETVA